jgi:hypothetical protein
MFLLKEALPVVTVCLPERQGTGFEKIRTWLVESNPHLAEILIAV